MEEDKCRHGTTLYFSWDECYDCAIESGYTEEEFAQARERLRRALEEDRARRQRESEERARERERAVAERRAKGKRDIPKLLILHPLGCGIIAALPFAVIAYVMVSVVREAANRNNLDVYLYFTRFPFLMGLLAGLVIGGLRLRAALK